MPVLTVVLGGVLLAFLEGGTAAVLGRLLDRVREAGDERWQASLVVALLVGTMLLVVGQYLVAVCSRDAFERAACAIRKGFAKSVALAPNLAPSRAHHLFGPVAEQMATYVWWSCQWLAWSLQAVILASAAVVVAPRTTLVAAGVGLGLGILLHLLFLRIGRRSRVAARDVLRARRQTIASLERLSNGRRLFRALRTMKRELELVERRLDAVPVAASVFERRSNLRTAAETLVVCLASAGTFYWSSGGSARTALLLAYLATRFLRTVRELSAATAELRARAPSLREGVPKLAVGGEIREILPRRLGGPPALVAEGLGFRRDSTVVFASVSFAVAPGELLAIEGPNGAGKSTLLSVLFGVEPPSEGTVLWNGTTPEAFFDGSGNVLGYVEQEPYFHQGTILDALSYHCPTLLSEDEAWALLDGLGLGDDLRRLPKMLGTPLDERGHGLSVGQRRRLAIARALAAKPAILFLDEPTASLDASSEQTVLNRLAELRGRCTVVVTTHSPRLLGLASVRVALPGAAVPRRRAA